MAGDIKDVELRIRARDYSQKTLEKLTETLADLTKAQEAQIEQAKKGEVSARSLEKGYQAIENAAKALISQHGLVTTFQKQSAALEAVRQRLDGARQAQEEHTKSLANADKLTKEQNRQLKDHAQAVKNAERAVADLEIRLGNTVNKMSQFGISANDAAAAQRTIVSNVGLANAALDKQAAAMDSLESDMRTHKAQTEAAAKAERDLAAARNTQVSNMWNSLLDEREAKEREITRVKEEQIAKEREQAKVNREINDQLEKQLQVDRQFADAQAKDAAKAKAQADAQAAAADAHREALDKAADQAERLSKEYQKMASSTKGGFTTGIADSLRDIANPAAAAVRSLGGVEKSLGDLETKIGAIKGPIKNYKQMLSEVEGVQKSLQETAGKVDAYTKQMYAVRDAREEFTKARTALAELTAQARSGDAGSDLANKMSAAQAAMKRASAAMSEQTSKAKVMREELRNLGVQTNDLNGVNQQLVSQAQRARAAVENLGTAYAKYGAEVEKAAKSQFKWFEGGRTTLSWMQRIRGEVLSLATAYVGLQAALNLAGGAIEAYKSKQAVESRLSQVVGEDAAAIKKEWDYLQGQAERLGFAFEPLAMAYSKFGIAAKSNGLSLEETRYIFEGFAEGARVAKMSTEDFDGALKAVEQMLSKGKIQAEELRQQLADRLPGAMAIAAEAFGGSMEELSKAMEKGEVSAEYVIDMARVMEKKFGPSLERATKSFASENERLQTAIYNFKLAIAEGGFIEAYTEFIKKLAEVLSSQEGQNMAKSLSEAFSKVVDILRWCADNVDTLKLAFAGFMGIQIFGWLSQVVANFGAMRLAVLSVVGSAGAMVAALRTGSGALATTAASAGIATGAISTTTRAVGLLTLAAKALGRALPIIGAAITAYEIYNALSGKKVESQVMDKANAAKAQADRDTSRTADPGKSGADNRVYNALSGEIERQDKALDKKMATANLKGAKADLAERKRLVDEHYDALRKQAETGISDAAKRAERLKQIEALSLKAQSIEEKKFANEQAKTGQGAANSRLNLARQVADELVRIEDDLRKRETENDPNTAFEERRKARLEAIAHEYDKLMRKIDQMARFDASGAAKAKEKVVAYIELRQKVEGMKADHEQLNVLEGKLNAQLQLRSTLYERLLAQYNAGEISREEFQASVIQNNATMAEGIASAGEKLRTFAESIKDILDPAAYETIMARIDTTMAKNNAVTQNAQQSLTFAQDAHNRLLAEYKRDQEFIIAQEEAGLLLKHQAIDAQAALNAQYRERMIQSAEEVRNLILAATTPENAEAMAVLTAGLDNFILKTQDARASYTALEQTVIQSGAQAINGAFDSMVTSLAEVIAGQKSIGEGFQAMGVAALQFFADFLKQIAMAILKQALLNALQAAGGGFATLGNAISGVGTKHTGGTVGSPGGTKRVDMGIFAGAARFHGGGLPGLTANEVPTILEKGEEVLTRDDPRHVLNGGGGGGGGSTRFVMVDDKRNVAEAMATVEGEKAVLVHLKKNIPTIKQWIR